MNRRPISRIIHFLKKLTPLDWIVCLILIGVVGFFLINKFSKKEEWVSVKLKVTNDEWWWNTNNPDSWYGLGLMKGQSAYNGTGKKIAEIQSIENYDIGGPRRLILANLNVLATYNKKSKTYTFNYQVLQIGKPLDFTFTRYNLHGLITYIGNDAIPYGTTELELKLLSIYPWEAESYKQGVLMKDLEENVVATIKQVTITDTQLLEIKRRYGELFFAPAPNTTYKDVTLRIVLRTYNVNSVPYYIDGSSIKIGNHIWIEFEQTAVKDGIISRIY